MSQVKNKIAFSILALVLTLACGACGRRTSSADANAPAVPAATTIPADADSKESSIRFLEARIKKDKDDFIAYNKLAGYYLQGVRETGDLKYLELARRAAQSSLEVLPAEQNIGGLAALTQTEFAAHEFAASRDHAQQLTKLEPKKSYPLQMLSDALIELGDYDQAAQVIHDLEKQSSGAGVEIRLGKLAWLRGNVEDAKRRFANAIIFAQKQPNPSREAVAWTRWQLGEIYFSTGEYEAAEKQYRDSLITFPDYYRALASLGRVLAARGDRNGAIENFEHATRILPDPTFVAALGDLYKFAGRDKDAQTQYALVEQISKLSEANGILYNRQIALFYADHEMKPDEAYAQAQREYEKRRDIYGADALAWTALKAGKTAEAQATIKEAMKLGTRDARIFYHAGLIAKASGDTTAARDYLQRALALNPQFDLLQAAEANKALDSLK
ncbi:MAG: tetratricopeptide repeat protein [Acidobacteria bacterium]|nr:tetratricopeptide repeat protein [Acidobacteriota bacterium]